ncbi:hypothetical protein OGM84_05465 [Pediococcus acidilactici]
MDTEKIEKIYRVFKESTELLQKNLDVDFLDAFIETGDKVLTAWRLELFHLETKRSVSN